MRIRPIQPDELPVFAGAATRSEHVATVHDYVSDLLIKGSMRTEWCYVAESRRRASALEAVRVSGVCKTNVPSDVGVV
jgi:hypothetical protein